MIKFFEKIHKPFLKGECYFKIWSVMSNINGEISEWRYISVFFFFNNHSDIQIIDCI